MKAGQVLAGLVLAGWTAVPVLAMSEHERALLEQLVREVDQLKVLVADAQSHSLAGSHLAFNYGALHLDIDRIREGILSHLRQPSRLPRSLPPLRAEYGWWERPEHD